MGFFSRLGGWFSGKSEAEQIQELAADAERFADRFENADMEEEAATCRGYAQRIGAAASLGEAEQIHKEFLEVVAKFESQNRLPRQEAERGDTLDDDSVSELSDDS